MHGPARPEHAVLVAPIIEKPFPPQSQFRAQAFAGKLGPTAYRLSSDFGGPKRCFSFGRGSNVASVPEPRHFMRAL